MKGTEYKVLNWSFAGFAVTDFYNGKCAMTWCTLYIVQHLLALDRHDDVSCTDEEIGQKGIAKLCRVPTAGVIISRAV